MYIYFTNFEACYMMYNNVYTDYIIDTRLQLSFTMFEVTKMFNMQDMNNFDFVYFRYRFEKLLPISTYNSNSQ